MKSTLRYGENPHQKAAFYGDRSLSLVNAGGIATAIQHHGKVRQSGFLSSYYLTKTAHKIILTHLMSIYGLFGNNLILKNLVSISNF
jgi:hypothetical protein